MASPQQNQPNLLTDLPDGALARILGLLPARDLAVVLRVCARLRAAAAAPPLWRALLRRDFGLPLAPPARRDEAVGAASSGGGGGAAGGSGGGGAGTTAAEFDALGAYATLAAAVGPPDDADEQGKGRRRRSRRSRPQPPHLHALRFSAAYCDGGVDRDNHDDYTFDHALCPNRWAPFCSESAVDVSIVGLLSDDRPAAQQHRPPNSNDAVVEEHRARLIERCRLAACQMFMKRIDFSALVPQQQGQQQQQEQEGGATAAAAEAAAVAAVMAAPTGGDGGGGDGPSNNTNNTSTPLSSNAATGHGPLRSTPAAARCAALAAAEATLAAWPTGTLRRLFFDLWGDLQQGEAMHGGAGTVPLDPGYTGPGRWGRLLLLEAEAAEAAEGGGGGGGEGGAAAADANADANAPTLIDPFRGAGPTARARHECADLAHQILFNDRLLPVAPEAVIVPRRPPARQQQPPEQEEQEGQQPPPQWGALSSSPGTAPPPATAPNVAPSPHFAPYCLAKARRTDRLVDVATHLRHFGPAPRANTATANPPPPPFGRRGVTACVREVVVSRAGELTCPVAAGVIMLGQVAGNTPLIGPTKSAPAPEKLYERLTGCDPAVADGFGDLMAQRVVEAADAAAAAAAAARGGGEAAARSALPSLLTASDVLRASKAGVLPPVLAHHVVDGGEAEWIEFCPPEEEAPEGGEGGEGNGSGSGPSSRPHRQKTSPLPLVLWWRFAARDELPPEIPDGWDPGEGALVSEMAVESVVAPWLASADAGTALAGGGGGGGDNGPSSSIANLLFGGGGTDNAAEMLALAAAGGIAMGGGGAWLDDDEEEEEDDEDDDGEELATADEDEDEEEEFFDEAEEADAPLTDSDGLPVGIGGAAAAGAGADVAGAATAAEEDHSAEPEDEVPWDAHGEADLPSSGGGGGNAPGPPQPQQQQPQVTPQMAALVALVSSSTMDARGPPRKGLRRREVLAHVETHPETVLEWPSLVPRGALFGVEGGDGSGGAASEEEEEEDESGEGDGEGDGGEGADAASAPQPPPRPHHHRTDLIPSAFDHAAAAATLRGEVVASASSSSSPPRPQQRGLAVLPPPPIAAFEAPLVRSSPGERIIASLYSKRDEQQRHKAKLGGRRRHHRATAPPAPLPLPPAQPTHTQVRMRLTRPRCGNTLVLRLLQPEDRMAEYHDHHPAPNVDVAFVSVRGVAVRLEGGGGEGGSGVGGAELRADVET